MFFEACVHTPFRDAVGRTRHFYVVDRVTRPNHANKKHLLSFGSRMTRWAIIKTNTGYFQVEIVKFIKNIFILFFVLRIIFY